MVVLAFKSNKINIFLKPWLETSRKHFGYQLKFIAVVGVTNVKKQELQENGTEMNKKKIYEFMNYSFITYEIHMDISLAFESILQSVHHEF